MNNNEWIKNAMLFYNVLNERVLTSKTIVIYGAAFYGINALMELRENKLDATCFCDRDTQKQGRRIGGIPVISPEELSSYPADTLVIISNELHIAQIKCMLQNLGLHNIVFYHYNGWAFEKESTIRAAFLQETGQKLMADNSAKIEFVLERLGDEKSKAIFRAVLDANFKGEFSDLCEHMEYGQYFPKDIISLHGDEVFVDCGACQGETTHEFRNKTRGYKWIYAFEPEPLQFEITKARIEAKKIERCTVLPLGVSSKKQELRFSVDGGSSSIDEHGEITIQVDALDNLLFHEPNKPTYIKMDIEGAELDALKGAKKLIERDHPKLAVSVYHKPEDIWEIPYYLLTMYPEYSICLRQHAVLVETTMYAVWGGRCESIDKAKDGGLS